MGYMELKCLYMNYKLLILSGMHIMIPLQSHIIYHKIALYRIKLPSVDRTPCQRQTLDFVNR